MNYCHRCESNYEKPGTCNCYAEKAVPDNTWIPAYPTYPVYPIYPTHPTWPTPTYPWYYYTTSGGTETVKVAGSWSFT